MTETEERKDKSSASFKLSRICILVIWSVSALAVARTAVPVLRHTLSIHHFTSHVILAMHIYCYVRAITDLRVVSLTEGIAK